MKLLKDTPLEVGWLSWAWAPGHAALTVIVKATYSLVPEGLCPLAPRQASLTGELHHDDDPEQSLRHDGDLAPYKPRGECFLLGSFHAPGGTPVRRSQAAFKVGPVTKGIAIMGDRVWGALGPSEPEPFTRMPIRWERAFGGPRSRENPLGRGLDKTTVDGTSLPLLPNLERVDALIQGRGDRPAPTCFAPVPRTFPTRLGLAGTYDARWQSERYPGLPEDFSWSFHTSAPEDQRIEGFWRGDEEIALMNLVEGEPRVRCALPGLWPRCLLVSAGDGPTLATEVELQLDTIRVDADAREVHCVWRAPREIARPTLEDYPQLFVTHDVPGAWRSLDRLRGALLAELDRLDREGVEAEPEAPEASARGSAESPSSAGAALAGGGPSVPVGSGEAGSRAAEPRGAASAPGPRPGDSPLFKTILGKELKWAGIDQALTVAGPSLSSEFMREMNALLRARGASAEQLGGWLAQGLPSFLAAPVEAPLDERELQAIERRVLSEEERLRERPDASDGRRRVLEAVERGESCAGWDLRGVDLSRVRLSGGDFRRAHLGKANLAGATFGDTLFDEAIFDNAELSDASFNGVSFRGAEIHFCRLERAHFADCVLDDARIVDSFLRDARFSRTVARRAELASSLLERTTFDDCDLGQADFSGATLDEALFARASMVDARILDGLGARRMRLDRCDLSSLRAFGGTDFEGSRFAACHAKGARFGGAKLDGCDLSFCDLERADFSQASLTKSKLLGSRLRSARFDGASLVGASLIRADLLHARFEGADLARADLRGANLFQAELLDAKLEGASFELANLDGTRLARR
jgi:uncharacterized protein YjbI with pentapeptide repeats